VISALPFRATCLLQALAAVRILRRRGYRAHLLISSVHEEQGRFFHAAVQVGESVFYQHPAGVALTALPGRSR
jgi:hypothetical protein